MLPGRPYEEQGIRYPRNRNVVRECGPRKGSLPVRDQFRRGCGHERFSRCRQPSRRLREISWPERNFSVIRTTPPLRLTSRDTAAIRRTIPELSIQEASSGMRKETRSLWRRTCVGMVVMRKGKAPPEGQFSKGVACVLAAE